jgi:pimeloyl-ACP methyl ester carboxylesterase
MSIPAMAEVVECDELGHGHPVLLVHGMVFGPDAFAATARALSPHARVLVIHRRGYGRSASHAAGAQPEDHAADILGLLDRLGIERVSALGVSGGATVLAAFAMAHPDRCAGIILHEPALGPLAPGVHALYAGLARAVAAAASPAVGADLLASALAGPRTWGSIGTGGRAEARRWAGAVRQEMPLHVRFAPTVAELSALRAVPVVAAVGSRSGSERREAAGVLARHAGAATALVPAAGNLAHLDNPLALAAMMRAQISRLD